MKLRIPRLEGVIKRRVLINFRVEAAAFQKLLPGPFRPKLQKGFAVAGICLIRLDQIRPFGLPAFLGFSSENAAHRVAVEWTNSAKELREGVFIPRRDTNSYLSHFTGGRIFPGEHHFAGFQVTDSGSRVDFTMQSHDKSTSVRVRGFDAEELPSSSCFSSLAESSRFFEGGCLGYSTTKDSCRLDGVELTTLRWQVSAFSVEHVEASYFAATARFPEGSVEFDHALIMRDIPHEWSSVEDMNTEILP